MNRTAELLDQYERYIDEGLNAYDHGKLKRAREYIVLAAERLFDIAEQSEGELKDSRIEKANSLLDRAELIDQEIANGGPLQVQGDVEEDSEAEFVPAEKPDIKLADVAGLEDVKKLIQTKLIDPFLFPELREKLGLKTGGGILLYGPPGTGKTLMARAIAGEVDAAFFHVVGSDILSKWVGDNEKNLRALFQEAGQHERAVVFFDEIDALAPSRQGSEDYMRRLVSQLLSEIEGFDQREGSILFLGATNHPSLLDPAMLRPGRFDELVYVPLPDHPARRALWELNLAKRQTEGDTDYEELAGRSEGYSGAEISLICDKAAQRAFERSKNDSEVEVGVTHDDVLAALKSMTPRTSQDDVRNLRAFAAQFDRNLEPDEIALPKPPATGLSEAAYSQSTPGFKGEEADASESSESRPEEEEIPFTYRPEAGILQRYLETMLSPFPHDAYLPQALATFLKKENMAHITLRLGEAVRRCFEVNNDDSLNLSHFSPPSGPDQQNPGAVHDEMASESPAESQAGVPVGLENDAGDTLSDAEPDPEILSQGFDLLDKYRQRMSETRYDELTERLYALAGQSTEDAPFELNGFEDEIVLKIAERETQTATGPDRESLTRKPWQNPEIDQIRSDAKLLVTEYSTYLDNEELQGFLQQINTANDLDLEDLRQCLDVLVTSKLRSECKELLDDRREFLDPAQAREIEENFQEEDCDFPAIKRKLQQLTFKTKLEKLVGEVSESMEPPLPRKESNRIHRKAVRQLERTGNVPTAESVRTLLKTISQDMHLFRQRQEKFSNQQAATIDDFEELIIRNCVVDFSDVAGMENLKNKIEGPIEVMLNPAKLKRYEQVTGHRPPMNGMLLFGTFGCGKTFFATAAAGELAQRYGLQIIHVPVRAITGKDWRKWQPSVIEIFNLARREAPCIVIWDEFDAIAKHPDFGGGKHAFNVLVNLRDQFDGIQKSGELIFHIATTNYPWTIDPALLRKGRLGTHIHLLPPDFHSRREAIELTLEDASLHPEVNYEQLAEMTSGMTMAEINYVLKEATDKVGLEALSADHNDGPRNVTQEDLASVITANPPSAFLSWLKGARQNMSKPKFEDTRELFKEFYGEDLPRFLDEGQEL